MEHQNITSDPFKFNFACFNVKNERNLKGITFEISKKYSPYTYLRASFNSFPGLNAGTFEAGIIISSPV